MTKVEARTRMLAALAAAGVNGVILDDRGFPKCTMDERDAFIDALRALRIDGVAMAALCGGRWVWRLSDQEFARRILVALRIDRGSQEAERIDAVVWILRGLQ